MICLSCRRRVDPNRSFCTSCGSSVFVEPGEDSARLLARYADPIDVTDISPVQQTPRRPKPRTQAPARPLPRRDPRAGAARATAAGAGAVAGLIRLAIFVAIVYYGGAALLRIPEVAAVKNALARGDSNELESAIQALRQRFDSSTVTADPTPASDADRPPPAAATAATSAVPEEPRPDAQVYLPGDGVSMPSPTVRVNPDYTPDALRRKVQGSVLLKCIVMPDFTVSEISVIKSLDPGLDGEAIKALSQWRFRPGRKDGRFVPVAVTIEMKFALP